jgi:hypothetical protein
LAARLINEPKIHSPDLPLSLENDSLSKSAALMTIFIQTTFLLVLSNLFMTFAWYGHLKNLSGNKWYIAALASWRIALFEYLIQVPANRIGYTALSLPQLKIMQEVITLLIFVPFTVFYMNQPLKLDFLWMVFSSLKNSARLDLEQA